jgi:nicotinamide-nucleotide amidase
LNAIILSIGDELVLGQTVDTNSAWISRELAAVGCDIIGHATVPDDQPAIEWAIRTAAGRCNFLVISGGIGPTEDDLTRQALAAVMGVDLEMNQTWLEKLIDFFKSRGREMPEINAVQAMIPSGATMIENTAGTAAGIRVVLAATHAQPTSPTPAGPAQPNVGKQLVSDEYMQRMFGNEAELRKFTEEDLRARRRSIDERRERAKQMLAQFLGERQTEVFIMPGVPREMKMMFTRDVLPHIAKASGGAVILSRTLHTFGMGESAIAEKLGKLMDRRRNPSVGTTVSGGMVSLRVNARFPSLDEARKQVEETSGECRVALGDLIFGQDDDTLPAIIGKMLTASGKPRTVTTAESCTGGLLAKMLTDIPGSSAYFKQGWVTYSNQAKYERLGVSLDVINLNGAVSETVVDLMAKNARRLAKADFALAISGIAGPDGGSPTKPVGTVCIALASDESTQTRTFTFTGDRETIRDRAAKMALTMLRFALLRKPLPF